MKDEFEMNQYISTEDPDGLEDLFNVPSNKSAHCLYTPMLT